MSASSRSLTLSEWETRTPDNCEALRGCWLDDSPATTSVVRSLRRSRLLAVTELRTGLEIKAFSYVGRIRIGATDITILPKIGGSALLRLLRYAYGFRHLELLSETAHAVDCVGFEDLLVSQLNAEVRELLSRGLQRSYLERREPLASPRGRIDVEQLARNVDKHTASLPCRHHPRIEDTFLNRVLLAGLQLAATLARPLALRREARRLATLLEEGTTSIVLNANVLTRAERRLDRLTKSYSAALAIVRLLVESQGVVLEGEVVANRVPGFLFDMNAFFQRLLSRWFRENLDGCEVLEEERLCDMMRFAREYNPQGKRSPTPRPDYVICQPGRGRVILDAKYRDLWAKALPREMLYQLVVYAISQRDQPQSTILYPTADSRAQEARIDVSDPVYGRVLGQVRIRPVDLEKLEFLVCDSTTHGRSQRKEYASWLVYGEPDP